MTNTINTESDKTLNVIMKCSELVEKVLKSININDNYEYETIPATLVEQRDLCKAELISLEKIQQDETKIVDCMNHLKAIVPLVTNKNYKRIKYFNQIDLPNALTQLSKELNTFHIEYITSLQYSKNKYLSAHKGLKGEKNLEQELNLYKDKIKTLNNIRLETEETTVESDSIIISSNGIFCTEVKNYGDMRGSGKIVVSEDGLWTRYSSNGSEVGIEDVTAQIYRHIGITQRFVNAKLQNINHIGSYIEFHPIIVIANDNIKIKNHSNIPILRVSNVFRYISTFKCETKLSKDICNKIQNILEENNKKPKPYPIQKRADRILSIYGSLIKKVEVFNNIDKVLKIEKNLLPIAFIGNERFIELLKRFDFNKKKSTVTASQSQLSCLTSNIEQLHQKTWVDVEVYEGIIKYYFNVKELCELSNEAAEHINDCIRSELQFSL